MATSYTIGSHYETFIKDLVDSGRYSTASEVMREGLRLIEEREEQRKVKLEALHAEIARGLASGPTQDWDVEELIAEAKRRQTISRRSK